MTQEEKAKAYDEALKWMRELYPGLHGATKEDAEHYFPELRESEDERIRRELIEYLRGDLDDITTDDTDRWITWIEKQKEQKPNYCHHEVDETGWTEEYRKAYYDGWNNCNMQHDQLKADHKPAEWSEKDNLMLTAVIQTLENFGPYGTIGMQIDWLKSLRPQQKQEWSKEDEKMRYFVTEAVQSRYSDRELAKYLNPKIINEKKQLKQKLFDWLRDLRPSWKPSEEDLEIIPLMIAILKQNYRPDSMFGRS